MNHSEQFLTEVLELWVSKAQDTMAAVTANDPNPSMRQPTWADLDMYQRQQIKQGMLPMLIDVLDAAKEVRGEVFIADCFPVRDEMVPTAMLTTTVSDDTRSEWRWLRTADGDLFIGFCPTGDAYMALENVVADDYDTALALEPGHPAALHTHTITVED